MLDIDAFLEMHSGHMLLRKHLLWYFGISAERLRCQVCATPGAQL